ncbi:putative nucleotidyltransferase-like protein [Stella humosa]|uniref:Putative nucleotidyltransferase-like protein n=1 Tax=Stella humosa TaxID=94 RepID=A0A3N1L387_9PROT|nr:nucleotidyltransferase family protein [Stella humosa]ROP83875.1 putative nucleotidyltransferase-like protein [Stella humosa]BBK32863.1 hypothetical protein STHU_34970 [Stella humosa]
MSSVPLVDAILPAGLITPLQEELLTIIYGPEAEAPDRFHAWQAGIDLTDLDDACYRLYPQLYRRIRGFAGGHPFIGRMKGYFRRTYYRNQLLFQWALAVVERLEAQGMDCLMLKGAALVPATGLSSGFRPMADVDLLVRTGDARRALTVADPRFAELLVDRTTTDAHVELRHGFTVFDQNRLEIDLHWRLAGAWAPGEAPDAPFWETARPVTLQDRPVLALAPTELLYHVIVHGIPRNPVPAIRWVSDSLELIAAGPTRIDWDRLAFLATHYRRRLLLRRGLAYLHARFPGVVPAHALDLLAGDVEADEEAEFRMVTAEQRTRPDQADARRLVEARLPMVDARLPGRRRLIYLNGRDADPGMFAWLESIGADFVCEFDREAALWRMAWAQLQAQPETARPPAAGQGRLYRFDAPIDLPTNSLYARVYRNAQGQSGMRLFFTNLTAWPLGAVVFRVDDLGGLPFPSIVGAHGTVPIRGLPIWPDFFASRTFQPD